MTPRLTADDLKTVRQVVEGVEALVFKPILCLDFDGVLHSYTSRWKGADNIPDMPVDGAMEFLVAASYEFNVQIFSSRSRQKGGRKAMKRWMLEWMHEEMITAKKESAAYAYASGEFNPERDWGTEALRIAKKFIKEELVFAKEKPPAMVTLDDRAITFEGTWPDPVTLKAFKPWNKR